MSEIQTFFDIHKIWSSNSAFTFDISCPTTSSSVMTTSCHSYHYYFAVNTRSYGSAMVSPSSNSSSYSMYINSSTGSFRESQIPSKIMYSLSAISSSRNYSVPPISSSRRFSLSPSSSLSSSSVSPSPSNKSYSLSSTPSSSIPRMPQSSSIGSYRIQPSYTSSNSNLPPSSSSRSFILFPTSKSSGNKQLYIVVYLQVCYENEILTAYSV